MRVGQIKREGVVIKTERAEYGPFKDKADFENWAKQQPTSMVLHDAWDRAKQNQPGVVNTVTTKKGF